LQQVAQKQSFHKSRGVAGRPQKNRARALSCEVAKAPVKKTQRSRESGAFFGSEKRSSEKKVTAAFGAAIGRRKAGFTEDV
jgi:hypothetical protein